MIMYFCTGCLLVLPGLSLAAQDLTVEPVVLKSDNAFAAYGLAGKYDDDGFSCRWQMVIPQTR
ncbi:putative phage related protein [Escherichia coli]|nr:putative phage related protein [Escherichia coli]